MPTVLLVEDDTDLRDVYRTAFEHAGRRTLEAGNGTDGLRIAPSGEPDLVALDPVLPGLDGWQLLERLRQAPVERTGR